MVAMHAGAQMTFHFNGTDVMLYGAKRSNHGKYQVAVDNGTLDTEDGFAQDPDLFRVLLFQSHGLHQEPHTMILTNVDDQKFVDVDFVRF
jgi:hypothetical protein